MPSQPLARMALGGARDVRGDVALGLAQADDQEHLRPRRADLAQATPRVPRRSAVARACQRVPRLCDCERAPLRGALGSSRPARARSAQSQRRPTRRICTSASIASSAPSSARNRARLPSSRQPFVGLGLDRERRPAVVERVREHAVAVHEADRRLHRSACSRRRTHHGGRCPGRARSPGPGQEPAAWQLAQRQPTRPRAALLRSPRSCAVVTSTAPGPV